MALDDLAGLVIGAIRFLYRVGTLFITLGLFLIVVAIFKGPQDFGVIPFRLILCGFGIESLLVPNVGPKPPKGPRVAGVVLLLISLVPTRFFLIAYTYFK